MRAVVQRCSSASVAVDDVIVGQISKGLLVLLGVGKSDTEEDVDFLIDKIVGLRIFDDPQGKMNLSLVEVAGELLVVSQFTLLADTRKGRRPSFVEAADPELGQRLYETFVNRGRELKLNVATGKFRAHMQVALVNDGPVTIVIDSRLR